MAMEAEQYGDSTTQHDGGVSIYMQASFEYDVKILKLNPVRAKP
jgi:hypothetical protein